MEKDCNFLISNDLNVKSTLNKTKLKVQVLNTYFSVGICPVLELMCLQASCCSSLGEWWSQGQGGGCLPEAAGQRRKASGAARAGTSAAAGLRSSLPLLLAASDSISRGS